MQRHRRFFHIILTIILSLCSAGKGLLCYRCDSQVSDDCGHYPAPMSSYEDCDEKPVRTYIDHKDWSAEKAKNEEYDHRSKQPLYIRYRYKLCPILEKTIKQYISIDSVCDGSESDSNSNQQLNAGPPRSPSPMEGVNFVCGKAVTHGPHGVRVRRGCTPDLFLNGTNACVSQSPNGYGTTKDIACFCTTDFCNHGAPSGTFYGSWSYFLNLSFTLASILVSRILMNP